MEWVDPTIGGVGVLLQPTRPAVHMPNSMVRMYPMRKDQLDDQIRSFPLTIISHRNGELFPIMPGAVKGPAAWDQEETTPYYYSTRFDESLFEPNSRPTERCGYFRFTFPEWGGACPTGKLYPGELEPLSMTAFCGEEQFLDMKAYVYGQWNQPVTMIVRGEGKVQLTAQADVKVLELRYGVSFISVEQAKRNLQREIGGSRFRDNQGSGQVTMEQGAWSDPG